MVLCYLILVHLISYYDIIIVNNNILCNWAIYMLFMILHVFVDNCSLLHINWTFPIIICIIIWLYIIITNVYTNICYIIIIIVVAMLTI